MTRRSLSEIQATCTKAARGAGCPWGLAQDLGMAARVLQACGLGGVEAGATLLKAGCCGGRGCSIVQAAALSDDLPDGVWTSPPVEAPLLLLAPLLWSGRDWQVTWEGGAAEITKGGVTLSGDMPERVALAVTPSGAGGGSAAFDWRSQPVDPVAWSALETWAQKTYVPETEQSRSAGAGPDS